MTHFLKSFRRARGRRRAAALRLHTARQRFDRSMIALRKAALDHIDSQDHVSATLRATLDRLVAQAGLPL
ncbi:hypothetical protein G3T14_18375 [Methylobacterium sp. BTF04]|uniref:hypothetical protein n=1 Tax=Methylobacterium sp. BTF04 TaxID=2708300 RepID=UPI0013D81E46|nr:hypothetical protein [Methylobacterium sp. BTF04]NEU14080.1 hypothetical protein [Methylobacterium sp. BTF04]